MSPHTGTIVGTRQYLLTYTITCWFNTVLVIAFFFLFNSFVEFKSSLSAMTALRELHNTKWGESHITVQWERSTPASPREKQSTKLLVAGLGTKYISHSALYTYIKRVP